MRPTVARTALLALVIVIVMSAPALAQSAFSPLPPATPDTTPTATATTSTTDSNGGLRTWQEILLFLGGVGLIGGISWAILSDARRAAPVSATDAAGHHISGAAARKQRSKEQARKKTKAQRAARKRNR